MTQKNFGAILLPILLVPTAVFITVNLLAGGGNQLGNTFILLMFLGGIIGFFAPKAGLLLFLITQFYVDFLKRLLVLGDALSMQDVMASLGLGPIIVVTACISCVSMCIGGKVKFSAPSDWLFLLGCIGISVFGAALASSRSITEMGQSMLGTAMLGMTAFACFILFRTKTDAYKALKYMIVGAIPMALYAVYQTIFGISQWEETYIRTGLSQVLYNFYVLEGALGMRPFSTLNTHSALGAMGGTLFVLSAFVMTRANRLFQVPRSTFLVYFLVSLLMLATCIVSRNRTTYFIPLISIFLFWAFSGGWRTLLFYAISFGGFVTMVVHSEYLNSRILDWAISFESTAFGQKFGSIGSYQDRLKGFIELSDSSNWTPFGVPQQARMFAHDQITDILLKLGYVPLLILLLVGIAGATWWHRSCLKVKDPGDRKFLILLSATMAALGICGLGYGNLIFVAPVNSVLGAMLGVGMSAIWRNRAAQTVLADNASETPALNLANPARS